MGDGQGNSHYQSSVNGLVLERVILDSLNTEEDSALTKNRKSSYGNFMNLLCNTIAKSKRKKKNRSSKANHAIETFLKGNAKLYLQVLMYCKKWRAKAGKNNSVAEGKNVKK